PRQPDDQGGRARPVPMQDRAGYALGCRMYATPEGLRGSPTA
ncbi:hypothetical protein AVDCRST_MAG82-800, partial [uncultured Rubrobacteraceae bacterium]